MFSYVENGDTRLFVKDVKSLTFTEILPVTIAEKCVWSTKQENVFFCGIPVNGVGSNEPDNWYLGNTHLTDFIWKFDSASEIGQLLIEPKKEFDVDLDVFEPKLSPNEDYLIFTNKRDLTLWAVKIQ